MEGTLLLRIRIFHVPLIGSLRTVYKGRKPVFRITIEDRFIQSIMFLNLSPILPLYTTLLIPFKNFLWPDGHLVKNFH